MRYPLEWPSSGTLDQLSESVFRVAERTARRRVPVGFVNRTSADSVKGSSCTRRQDQPTTKGNGSDMATGRSEASVKPRRNPSWH